MNRSSVYATATTKNVLTLVPAQVNFHGVRYFSLLKWKCKLWTRKKLAVTVSLSSSLSLSLSTVKWSLASSLAPPPLAASHFFGSRWQRRRRGATPSASPPRSLPGLAATAAAWYGDGSWGRLFCSRLPRRVLLCRLWRGRFSGRVRPPPKAVILPGKFCPVFLTPIDPTRILGVCPDPWFSQGG